MMGRPKTPKPQQLPLQFERPVPAEWDGVSPLDTSYFDDWCDQEERRALCDAFLRAHAAAVAFVAIVVARARAQEVAR